MHRGPVDSAAVARRGDRRRWNRLQNGDVQRGRQVGSQATRRRLSGPEVMDTDRKPIDHTLEYRLGAGRIRTRDLPSRLPVNRNAISRYAPSEEERRAFPVGIIGDLHYRWRRLAAHVV